MPPPPQFSEERALSDQSGAQSLGHGLGFGMDLKLLVDVLYVKRNRVKCCAHLGGCAFITVPIHQEFQDAQLVRRKVVIGVIGRPDRPEYVYDPPRDFG